ncbi:MULTISPECIES: carbohydrate ABC transporter permease [Romboutsia]|jgi:putative aldouronate transport system permease protein|uniref:carbohydrate ABC transporter permease n=1 Tax=Romboutsia TaxID=1501226 RepID=UPI002172696F|nr:MULTISPECIES: carbohydrate ABC transporter permease [Romboutsia]MCI9061227.1 carbohydrate ABC transporter permease [Romboutsia sp.]MCI9259466.1 carbohydrate ABC transporter permease [Romboutsia sp.]
MEAKIHETKTKNKTFIKKRKKAYNEGFTGITNIIANIILAISAIACVFPFIFVIIISLTSEQSLLEHGYSIFPKEWSLDAYKYLLQSGGALAQSYMVTILVTILGTIINVSMVSTYAYAISRKGFKYRRQFTFLVFFTMLFGGGMVPSYIVMTQVLGLKNTIWALILPLAFNSFNIIVMRTFFQKSVPDSIIESARIDGASEFRIFIKIVIPLAIPGIATIALFSTLAYWNDWFNAMLYIDYQNLVPLQHMLMKIEKNMEFIRQNAMLSGEVMSVLPQESVRMAMVVASTLPIACTYPFFQKYFISGLTIGGVKE